MALLSALALAAFYLAAIQGRLELGESGLETWYEFPFRSRAPARKRIPYADILEVTRVEGKFPGYRIRYRDRSQGEREITLHQNFFDDIHAKITRMRESIPKA